MHYSNHVWFPVPLISHDVQASNLWNLNYRSRPENLKPCTQNDPNESQTYWINLKWSLPPLKSTKIKQKTQKTQNTAKKLLYIYGVKGEENGSREC